LFDLPYRVSSRVRASDQNWYRWTGRSFRNHTKYLLTGRKPTISGVAGLDQQEFFRDLPVFEPAEEEIEPLGLHVTEHRRATARLPVFPAETSGEDLAEQALY